MSNKILDVTAGGRMMWFDKNHPLATYCDFRYEPQGVLPIRPNFSIEPNIVCDFTNLPFPDECYRLVIFDPPHRRTAPTSITGIKFGSLVGNWQEVLSMGFREVERVLEPYGVLIFKWGEISVKINQVLELVPEGLSPVVGHTTAKSGTTKWVTFMKVPKNDGPS